MRYVWPTRTAQSCVGVPLFWISNICYVQGGKYRHKLTHNNIATELGTNFLMKMLNWLQTNKKSDIIYISNLI